MVVAVCLLILTTPLLGLVVEWGTSILCGASRPSSGHRNARGPFSSWACPTPTSSPACLDTQDDRAPLVMSRRRKPGNRRPKRSREARTTGGRRPRPSRSESSSRGVAVTKGTKLIPRSLVFVGPEEAVATFEVEHPATLGGRIGGRAPQDATIIKGCPRRYALETCESLQMGTLSYYRKQGGSLIWDLGEGVIAGDERTERRRDSPADLDAYKQTDIELSVGHLLGRALGPATTKRLDVTEVSQASLLLGDNCLIWCASLEPQTAEE